MFYALVHNFLHLGLQIYVLRIGERLVVPPQVVVGDVPVYIGADGAAGHAQALAEQQETTRLEVPVVTGVVGETVVGAVALDIFPGVEHGLLQVAAPAKVKLRLEQDGGVLAELVLQAHAKAVAVREAVALAVRVRIQRAAVGQISLFIGVLGNIHDGTVIEVVATQGHLLVKQVPVTVDAAHPGGGDAIGAAPVSAAAHTAHAATAAHHGVHHGAGEVVEPTVVGVVAIEDDADLAVLRKAAAHGRRLPAGCIGTTGCGQVHAAAHHGIAKQAVHHAPFHGKVDDGFFFTVVNTRKLCLLALFLHHFHLFDEFGGDVLRSQLRVVQEEGFTGNGNLGDGFSVGGDGAVLGHLDAGKLLQEVHQHIVVANLKGRCIVLHRILLDDHGVTHGAHRGGIQHLLVLFQLDDTQVHIGLEFQGLLEGLVTHNFRLKGVLPRFHFFQQGMAVAVRQGVFGLSFFRGKRNGGKTYRFCRSGIL